MQMKMDAVSPKQLDLGPNKTYYILLAASSIFSIVVALWLVDPVTSTYEEVNATGVLSCFAGLGVVAFIWLLVWCCGKKRERQDTNQQQQQQQQKQQKHQQQQGSEEGQEAAGEGNSDATGSLSSSSESHEQEPKGSKKEIQTPKSTVSSLALQLMSDISQQRNEVVETIWTSYHHDSNAEQDEASKLNKKKQAEQCGHAVACLRYQDRFRVCFMEPFMNLLHSDLSSGSAGATAGGGQVAQSTPPNPFSSKHLPSCAHLFNMESAGFCFAAVRERKCVACYHKGTYCKGKKKAKKESQGTLQSCLFDHSQNCGCNELIKELCHKQKVQVVCPRQVLKVSEHMLSLHLHFHATF
jgi:hypothetical protein